MKQEKQNTAVGSSSKEVIEHEIEQHKKAIEELESQKRKLDEDSSDDLHSPQEATPPAFGGKPSGEDKEHDI